MRWRSLPIPAGSRWTTAIRGSSELPKILSICRSDRSAGIPFGISAPTSEPGSSCSVGPCCQTSNAAASQAGGTRKRRKTIAAA